MATWTPSPSKPGIYWVAPKNLVEHDNETFVDHPQYLFQPYAHLRGHFRTIDPDEWYFAADMHSTSGGRPLHGRLVCAVDERSEYPKSVLR